MDSLIFMPDSIRAADVQEQIPGERSSSKPQGRSGKKEKEAIEKEAEIEVEVENVERPVDLYKAIFSDDSDDEDENNTSNQVEDTEKKIEAANTALNRLMAGDFLETLGKELGLSVPPEMPPPDNKPGKKVATDADERNESPPPAKMAMPVDQKTVKSSTNGSKLADNKETKSSKARGEDARPSSGKASSSEDERRKKHSRSSRRKSRRSRSSVTDSSDESDVREERHSRSRRDDKERGKSSSRRHSKHDKHKRKDSPSRSHRSSEHERHKRKKKH